MGRPYQGPAAPYHETPAEETATLTRAMIAPPVHAGEVLCGVLSAINPREGKLFTGAQLGTLEAHARGLGVLLEESAGG